MDVVVYKARGKNGYLYDMSLNPYVDFEILRSTRNVKALEVLTPKIPIENGEAILKNIYGKSILKKIVSTHEYFIRRGLKKLRIKGVRISITNGIDVPSTEEIARIEEQIMGKVITLDKLLNMKAQLELTEENIINIIQLLYCERRIRMIPSTRRKKNQMICSFCEKILCNGCCLGFKNSDILLYAADNYNIGVPRDVGFKRKKLTESLTKAADHMSSFSALSKKDSAVLWCVPWGFDYAVLTEGLAKIIMTGGKILYITAPSLIHETETELNNLFEGVSIGITNKNDLNFKNLDISICSYTDYPCFHKAFDLVIYDERVTFYDRPLDNMDSIGRRAVKEKGKFLNITCFPKIKPGGHGYELITIPITYSRSPIPEPLIVISRLLKESLPGFVIDTIKWSVHDNFKMIIFVPDEDSRINVYNNIVNLIDIKSDIIDFSTPRDKTAIMRLKRKEIQILISNDLKDAGCIIEDLNVIVMQADQAEFSREALMYMSAMAGFHTKKKCGQVIFTVEKENEDVTTTKDRIRGINKIAWENGFIRK